MDHDLSQCRFTTSMQASVQQLIDQQLEAEDQWLCDYLTSFGIDPYDRSLGWQDRARTVLSDLQVNRTIDMDDNYQVTITTVIRQRDPNESVYP